MLSVNSPELTGGVKWFNSSPVEIHKITNKVVLVDFWTYSCVNCIRTLPHLTSWHKKYLKDGLVIVGVHTPEFEFEKDSRNIEKAIKKFGIEYPVVNDANYKIWNAFANNVWPRKFLIDKNKKIRYEHSGEGDYEETEKWIQKLLAEVSLGFKAGKAVALDHQHSGEGGVCFPHSPETYLGYVRGYIGNKDGFAKNKFFKYSTHGEYGEGFFYLSGNWKSTSEYIETGEGGGSIDLMVKGLEVNLVAESKNKVILGITLNGFGIEKIAGKDIGKDSALEIGESGLYSLIKSQDFLSGVIELRIKTAGVKLYAFTFGGCA